MGGNIRRDSLVVRRRQAEVACAACYSGENKASLESHRNNRHWRQTLKLQLSEAAVASAAETEAAAASETETEAAAASEAETEAAAASASQTYTAAQTIIIE